MTIPIDLGIWLASGDHDFIEAELPDKKMAKREPGAV